ncbi:NAD(P)-binding protein [Desulfovermiculus halophilus]|jgi:putative selenate reductase YgfK subunit|uniref:NAD(P)-binding protein n=1 Tax=Desulfovermiculus halophilus TaxID=339722 RepID=UPI0004871BCB|nr:NAD(P)-binding protein [Desulfovermiculus halophilus]
MTEHVCPVTQTIDWLNGTLETNRVIHPRARQLVGEALARAQNVAQGRGRREDLQNLEELAQKIKNENISQASTEIAQELLQRLNDHFEVFASHIDTHTCPTSDCPQLTPAPCQMACPAGIDIPSYVTLIGQGRYDEAIEVIRKDNPFPWVCGLVCTHPCEFMCVRKRMDSPISIMDLKGFAAERAMSDRSYVNPEKSADNGHKVCVLGGGPGGLTAAYFLALWGYRVTVLEALPMAGGMMMVGIPRYRLPREVIDREVGMIEELGVELRLNTKLGRDTSLDDLKAEGFEAFVVAIGAHDSFKLMIPGEDDFAQVFPAVQFLRRVSVGDRRKPGRRVAVIGGGNVAIDAARTCVRLGCEEVSILYRRTHSEMPAHEQEVVEAEEEGVQFSFLTIPTEVVGANGRVTAIRCLRARLSEPDSSGRQRPVPVEGSEHDLEVDAVIPAIGQSIDPSGLQEWENLKWTRRNNMAVNTATMATPEPGVFAVGDVVTGPATVVEAIGAGKKAAWAVHRYIEDIPQPTLPPVPVRRRRLAPLQTRASLKADLKRPEIETLKNDRRRITFQQVHLGLPEDKAQQEAKRCLRCDICIRCGKCVDICRDQMGVDALHLGYLDFDHPGPTDLKITAERCILCGACATNCPTGAMQMRDKDGERVLMLCGTVLNRMKLEYCESCGTVLGPARYHDFISQRLQGISPALKGQRLCLQCARKESARNHAEIRPPDV